MYLCISADKVRRCDRAFDGCSSCEDTPLAVTEHLSDAEVLGLTDFSYRHEIGRAHV